MKRRFLSITSALTVAVLLQPFATTAHAIETADTYALEVSKPGDLEMSCGELSEEALLMNDIIATTQDIRDNSEVKERGIGVAGAAASFLVGTLTGGLGIAAAGYLANEAVEGKGDNAESVQDVAEQRRSFVTGIYNSKGCLGPIDHAMQKEPGDAPETKAEDAAKLETAAGETTPPSIQPAYNQ
jgi:hypothetical protein